MDCAELEKTFLSDINRVAETFINAFGLSFSRDEVHLADPLARWLDFSCRYIEPKQRRFIASRDLESKEARLPVILQNGLSMFRSKVETGDDINPFQSKGLYANDVSSEKRQGRTDLLFADWSIHHFHLTDVPVQPGTTVSDRSDFLLFGVVFSDAVLAIDAREHPKGAGFADRELLEIAIRNWPALFQQYGLPGALALAQSYSNEELHQLRKAGVTVLQEIAGRVYMPPGLGVTTASTPTHLSLKTNEIRRGVKPVAKFFQKEDNGLSIICRNSTGQDPDFHIVITPKGLAVYEPNIDQAQLIEPLGVAWAGTVAPAWAIARLSDSAAGPGG